MAKSEGNVIKGEVGHAGLSTGGLAPKKENGRLSRPQVIGNGSDGTVLLASVGVLEVALAGNATGCHRVGDQARNGNFRFTVDA